MGFYRRVGQDPVMAAEVMAQLEADPMMKRNHLALYLCCKQSLRTHKATAARNRRKRLRPASISISIIAICLSTSMTTLY